MWGHCIASTYATGVTVAATKVATDAMAKTTVEKRILVVENILVSS